ncbi:hypothetical protein V8E55_009012 [Tylopilus felleus]
MDQSSAFVWKTARTHLEGMPNCPAHLTEQEYAHLAFCARCYGCGRYADTVFWEIRRRYCSDCKASRLCHLSSCHEIIQKKYVLGMGHLTSKKEIPFWVDIEQMQSFMDEYEHSSQKEKLLGDKQEKLVAIRGDARRCEIWHRIEQQALRQDRENSIFEHLKQLGYQYEIEYFGDSTIRESRKPLFDTSKPLTDKEWDRICPTWLKAMNDFRLQRLERNVYYWRRRALKDEYKAFVAFPSPYTPSFDLLPHVADVACFPPFRDIIKAPEGTPMNDKLFESAFAQLPEFVDEWKKRLDAEVAEMVQIPSHLSLKDTSSGQISTSSNTVVPESSKGPADKLRLACALFRGRSPGIFTYPDVFLSCKDISYPSRGETDSGRTGSVWDRYGIKYVGEAPYVVHACGLDPTLATEQDMERRDARLKCLCCGWSGSWGWREAILHACLHHANQARWQLVDDDSEQMKAIRGARLPGDRGPTVYTSRCLLCPPRVGDEMRFNDMTHHLLSCHNLNIGHWDVQQGMHYQPMATADHRSVVQVEERDQEEFKFKVVWHFHHRQW